MKVVDRARWDEVRELAGEYDLPPYPGRLPRSERVRLIKLASQAGMSQRAIAAAFGVSQPAVSNTLRGKQPWRQIAGRGRSTKPRRTRQPPAPAPAPVEVKRPEEEDDPPDESWWQDDDDDEPEPELPAASRARAQPARRRKSQAFGSLTGITAARLAAAGYPLTPQGNVDWTAYNAQQTAGADQEPVSAPPPAPERIPSAPAVRPPVATSPVGPAPARPTGIPARATEVGVRLACGCQTFVLPASARRGAGWNCAGRHGATTVASLTGRYTMG